MIVHVALPLPIHKLFSYQVPEGWEGDVRPGLRVNVPFTNRFLPAFVLEMEERDDPSLKSVADVLDPAPPLDEATFALCNRAARRYLASAGIALKYAAPTWHDIERFIILKAMTGDLAQVDGMPLKKACARLGKRTIFAAARGSSAHLLDSFTGSTYAPPEGVEAGSPPEATLLMTGVDARVERYVSLIRACLDGGRNALMLLPDYHTGGEWFSRRLRESFGENVLWYGSAVSTKQRMETFFRARSETGRLVLGNKSAVFLPVSSLGLIVVERPEEDEYRNETAFKFSAVEVALERSRSQGVPFVAGSAAPPAALVSLAKEGAMKLEEKSLPHGRVHTIAVERRKPAERPPPELISVMEDALSNEENIAVYTPRRDYASYLYCTICKKPFLCPACSGVLTYRKEGDVLSCPACKRIIPYDETCGDCGTGLIRFASTGAEYLEEHLREALPHAAILRVTGDALGKRDLRMVVRAAGIPGTVVVGTRLLSKLYDLRVGRLVLIGWEDHLYLAGYRGRERMFQAYRNLVDALKPDHVDLLVQHREALDFDAMTDPAKFYSEELAMRKAAGFPPFGRLFLVQVEKRGREAGERLMAEVEGLLDREGLGRDIIGPIELRGRGHRWRLILKGDEDRFANVLPTLLRMGGVRVEPDPTDV